MKVALACVSENRPEWLDKVRSLALSVRRLGGSLADVPFIAHFVEGAAPEVHAALGRLDVEVREVDRVDPRYPYANKLRMFELDEGYDVVIGLDCDTIVVGDPGPFVDADAVSAKPADCDFLTADDWADLFRSLGLTLPPKAVVTTTFDQRTYPYFNSGVLSVPAAMLEPLHRSWREHVYRIQDVVARSARLALYGEYADQLALSAALASTGLPIRGLPVTLNFPTHLRVHPRHWDGSSAPRIIHYHKRVSSDGFVMPSGYAAVNERIEAFNRARSDHLGLSYPGLSSLGLIDRAEQALRSRPWFHRPAVKTLRRRLGGVLAPIRDAARKTV